MVCFFQNGMCQIVAGQRAGGDNRPTEVLVGKFVNFFMRKFNQRVFLNFFCNQSRKTVPVNSQSTACGNLGLVGAFHNQ